MQLCLIYLGAGDARYLNRVRGEKGGRGAGRGEGTEEGGPGMSPITPVCLNSFVIRAISSGYLCVSDGGGEG
jgi:hypothetical protein